MILNLIFSFFLSQNNSNLILGERGCGLGPEDLFFINSNSDFNQIQNCSTINGSVFINGDYHINSLTPMKNIETINGYLVIYDSHILKSLKGLHNLREVHAYNPYLLEYGVTIKYNNYYEDNSSGLCFSDLINWDKITNKSIIVSNNRLDCPECHFECDSCFGPGRLLCQTCINYKSGDSCVDICPNGTNIKGNICEELNPIENI